MIRSMMQVYVKNSHLALEMYEQAFQTKRTNLHTHSDNTILHAELNVFGQWVAISEAYVDVEIGNTMQFCLQFKVEDQRVIEHAYEFLKVGATITHPLDQTFYSPLMFSLIDRFGVSWCMFLGN